MDHSPVGNLDQPFLDAAAVCSTLLRADALRKRWAEPSALPELSVGALACHLARQVTRAAELLAAPPTLPTLAVVDEHYARAAWVTAESVHDPANDRTADDAEAAEGVDWMLARFDADLASVADRLPEAADTVDIPWQGWSLRRDDFLHTRLLELIVHSADLAASLGVPAPEFPDAAFVPVLALLARLAVRRHGQGAVVSTLTRRERAQNISAF
ncbi:maleylpyruvate isomerase N-terminal domain-containing protein [Amycolatopsis sp. FDAARGOS 1241]|uniref:maleylpyruvate isomerase N-terminal domain-containing protein n=1 Tax=Amycolatopsis sp. FDAARGOS 1241 TaxID=2778070 RepID=UPI00195173E7|nr:maleylpyruvate isomerase N-terminal domain-containing protein [Amycolatopsis sp. FDAARGOS 1241]QRP46262.1 maleylpyruvate isomerase N-terminal domain-containing protein [Amycolatopsis sp. FDAARGOS 1241]